MAKPRSAREASPSRPTSPSPSSSRARSRPPEQTSLEAASPRRLPSRSRSKAKHEAPPSRPTSPSAPTLTIQASEEVIKPGDTVLLKASSPSEEPYVARVEGIEATGRRGTDVKVRVRWYYRPEEVRGGRKAFHGSKEVFFSDHLDIQSGNTIEGKCRVHNISEYSKLDVVNAEDFVCRFEYTPATGLFVPEQVDVFCVCKTPYNPDEFMIECEGCAAWFHPMCIGMAVSEAEMIEKFLCQTCNGANRKKTGSANEATSKSEQAVSCKYGKLWSVGVDQAIESFATAMNGYSPEQPLSAEVERAIDEAAQNLADTLKALKKKNSSALTAELAVLRAAHGIEEGSIAIRVENNKKLHAAGKEMKPDRKSASVRNVAVIYDEGMMLHKPPNPGFREKPSRMTSIMKMLMKEKIIERCDLLKCEEASKEYLEEVHSTEYVADILKTSSMDQMERDAKALEDSPIGDLYYAAESSKAARLAAGGVVKACQLVAEGRYQSSFAVVRPPGHHAGREKAEGFCLFNNIAVGAAYLLKNHQMKKILIIDWDVHHGNGTESIFYNDERVLYFSIHRYKQSFYPGTGHYFDIGEGGGTGYNVNVCWGCPSIRNIDYFAVWDHLLIPIVKEFKPEAILISAGFDAAEGDPLGDCSVTASGFATLLEKLLGFGPIVMALEGGYNLRSTHSSLPMCVASCIRVLLGDNIDVISETESSPYDSTWKMIQKLRAKLRPIWGSLGNEIPEEVTLECTPSISTDLRASGEVLLQPSSHRSRRLI